MPPLIGASRGCVREFDREHRFLAACALAPRSLDLSPALRRLRITQESWVRLATSGRLNQLRPQLAVYLERHGTATPADDTVHSEIETVALAHRGNGLLASAELIRILGALQARGIRAVAFKGPAFATFVGDGPQLREMTDLDVLIDASSIRPSVEALEPLGYRTLLPPQAVASSWLGTATKELTLSGPHASTTLELHWRLAPAWCPAAITAPEVFARVTERDFFGSRILWPYAEELLLLHIADGMKSGGCGMRWIGDLAAILRGAHLDWDRVGDVARRNGGLDSVRIGLAMVDTLSRETARACEIEELVVDLQPPARMLVRQAQGSARLRRAIGSVRKRLACDLRLRGPLQHFVWALQVADDPFQCARAIARYLLGPALADLASMPPQGLSDAHLRLRAFTRRLGAT